MNRIKHLAAIVAGALIVGFLFYKLIGPAGQWYELHHARNDGDLGTLYMVALGVQCVSIVVGGWLGSRVYRRLRRGS
ncbi:hypothetical protein ACEN9J_28800 [Variovorax sp. Varisp41]|uniref:hypothetical protein n=1 Tax=Variovorax sp. Varisp41 TaxID=3243033 RepID=UPI0039B5DEA7